MAGIAIPRSDGVKAIGAALGQGLRVRSTVPNIVRHRKEVRHRLDAAAHSSAIIVTLKREYAFFGDHFANVRVQQQFPGEPMRNVHVRR